MFKHKLLHINIYPSFGKRKKALHREVGKLSKINMKSASQTVKYTESVGRFFLILSE